MARNEEEKKKYVVLADFLRKPLEAASTRPGTDPRIGNWARTTNPPLHLLQQEARDKRAIDHECPGYGWNGAF